MPIRPLNLPEQLEEVLPVKKSAPKIASSLGIILLLLVGGITLAKHHPSPPPASAIKLDPKTLTHITADNGLVKGVQTQAVSVQQEVGKTAQKASENLVSAAGDFIHEKVDESTAAVGNALFQNTVENIVKQIKKLSPQQQKEIKEALCK